MVLRLTAFLLILVLLSGCGAIRASNPQIYNDRVQIILESGLESQDKLTAITQLFEREGDQGGNFLSAWRDLLELITALSLGIAVANK